MRRPEDLTHEELLHIADCVQRFLYLDTDEQGALFWNPDNDWSGADVCQDLAGVLSRYAMVPQDPEPYEVASGEDSP